jgi:NADH dehydrogenase [ubiquinone] 1 alpha subcomplex assembly factor 5
MSVFNLTRRVLPVARHTRRLASVTSSAPPNPHTLGPFDVFNRHAKRLQKDRAASKNEGESSRTVDYVREEIADSLMERFLVSHGLCGPFLLPLLTHFALNPV